MIVYRDIISGDEMMSDAFKLTPVVDDEGATVSDWVGWQGPWKALMLQSLPSFSSYLARASCNIS